MKAWCLDYSRKFWKWTNFRETNRKHLPGSHTKRKLVVFQPSISWMTAVAHSFLIFRPQPTEVVPVYKLYSLTIQELKITHQNKIIWIAEMNQKLFCFPSNVKPMSFEWKSSPKILKTKTWNPGTLPGLLVAGPNSSKPQVGMEDDKLFLQKAPMNVSLYLNTQNSCIFLLGTYSVQFVKWKM